MVPAPCCCGQPCISARPLSDAVRLSSKLTRPQSLPLSSLTLLMIFSTPSINAASASTRQLQQSLNAFAACVRNVSPPSHPRRILRPSTHLSPSGHKRSFPTYHLQHAPLFGQLRSHCRPPHDLWHDQRHSPPLCHHLFGTWVLGDQPIRSETNAGRRACDYAKESLYWLVRDRNPLLWFRKSLWVHVLVGGKFAFLILGHAAFVELLSAASILVFEVCIQQEPCKKLKLSGTITDSLSFFVLSSSCTMSRRTDRLSTSQDAILPDLRCHSATWCHGVRLRQNATYCSFPTMRASCGHHYNPFVYIETLPWRGRTLPRKQQTLFYTPSSSNDLVMA